MSAEENLKEVNRAVNAITARALQAYEKTMCDGAGCCGNIDAALEILSDELREVMFQLRDLED